MTSSLVRLRGLARCYSNLATALAESIPSAAVRRPWEPALHAALQCLDARQADVLAGLLETTRAGYRPLPLSDLGIKLPMPSVSRGPSYAYARRAGLDLRVQSRVLDEHVSAQTEIAAILAWAEVERRTGRHHVMAAKALQRRCELLQAHLVPNVLDGLAAAANHEAGLLTVLAWVMTWDLRQAVTRRPTAMH